MQTNIQIVFPSSACQESLLTKALADLESADLHAEFHIPVPHPQLRFLASSVENRVSELSSALLSNSQAPILCARGGYGASDLLPHLPWSKLKTAHPKLLVGFSDISALQSALFSKLGWPSIHGPMPATELWGQNGNEDILLLCKLLKFPKLSEGKIRVQTLSNQKSKTIEGWLFGGCMSVLCNLIGTPYFPHSLRGAIFFLEDTGEHPGRILRMMNQLVMSEVLEGVSALVLGDFGENEFSKPLLEEITKRVSIPVFLSSDFGHISPNFPLMLGANASIENQILNWSYGA